LRFTAQVIALTFAQPAPSLYLYAYSFNREVEMPARNLKKMEVNALMALRSQIDSQLAERRTDLEKQIARLDKVNGQFSPRRALANGKASALKGTKVKPKYRDPKTGQTWSGRGAVASWLAAAIKQGRKLEHFTIKKVAASRNRSAVKKTRQKRR
jgi:DNA-binding protein H-NS